MMLIITERAMVGRINRRLARSGQVLRMCPSSSRWHISIGRYQIIDAHTATLLSYGLNDLNTIAEDLGIVARVDQ